MQYNFKVTTSFSDDELKEIADKTIEGLNVASQLSVEAKITVNTELPEDKVESLKAAVQSVISERLGETEIELTSIEH